MIANFILALTYFARITPDVDCDLFLEEDEWKLLYRFAKRTKIPPDMPYSLAEAIRLLGQLGVGKRAPGNGDYGVKAIWLESLLPCYGFTYGSSIGHSRGFWLDKRTIYTKK